MMKFIKFMNRNQLRQMKAYTNMNNYWYKITKLKLNTIVVIKN